MPSSAGRRERHSPRNLAEAPHRASRDIDGHEVLPHGVVDDIAGGHQNFIGAPARGTRLHLFGPSGLGVDEQVGGMVPGPEFDEHDAAAVRVHGGDRAGPPGRHADQCYDPVIHPVLRCGLVCRSPDRGQGRHLQQYRSHGSHSPRLAASTAASHRFHTFRTSRFDSPAISSQAPEGEDQRAHGTMK